MSDIWITEDKREIPVEKMEDGHVMNALRCFRAKAVAEVVGRDFEEGSLLYFLQQERRKTINARVAMMEREAARRGLDV